MFLVRRRFSHYNALPSPFILPTELHLFSLKSEKGPSELQSDRGVGKKADWLLRESYRAEFGIQVFKEKPPVVFVYDDSVQAGHGYIIDPDLRLVASPDIKLIEALSGFNS